MLHENAKEVTDLKKKRKDGLYKRGRLDSCSTSKTENYWNIAYQLSNLQDCLVTLHDVAKAKKYLPDLVLVLETSTLDCDATQPRERFYTRAHETRRA